MSKRFRVTIYPVTPWTVEVEADTEDEAKDVALGLDGPPVYAFRSDNLDEWVHDIMEWPNIGNDTVDIEEIDE